MEQGEAEGEGEQRGPLRSGQLRKDDRRGPQVQADHSVRALREAQGIKIQTFCFVLYCHRKDLIVNELQVAWYQLYSL
ncbi:40S ribosomal protein S25-1 [Iris pallida]|uniref:40S ribosomal protein S25-1 n=1 Tax=Iris pallida TaxID=29817 RepID=A0AAX6IB74_IRIPA|nr:40S ribosomal protein S25-1 [Iris pallida]